MARDEEAAPSAWRAFFAGKPAPSGETAWLGGLSLLPSLPVVPLVARFLAGRGVGGDGAPDALVVALAVCSLVTLVVVPILAFAALEQAWTWRGRPATSGDRRKVAFGALSATAAALISLLFWVGLPTYFRTLN